MIIMNGMKVQASSTMIEMRAAIGIAEEGRVFPAERRASVAAGPKRYSISDLPTIQHTATGDSMKGSRKTTRKNLRARIWALRSSARPKAMAYSTSTAST